MGIIKFAAKVGLMSGVCYVTSEYGIWKDSRRSEEIYKEMYSLVVPYIKEVPMEIPQLPKASEVTSAVRGYWNRGVVTSADFIAEIPIFTYSVAKKGSDYVTSLLSDSGEQQ